MVSRASRPSSVRNSAHGTGIARQPRSARAARVHSGNSTTRYGVSHKPSRTGMCPVAVVSIALTQATGDLHAVQPQPHAYATKPSVTRKRTIRTTVSEHSPTLSSFQVLRTLRVDQEHIWGGEKHTRRLEPCISALIGPICNTSYKAFADGASCHASCIITMSAMMLLR